jgi:YfiH family protein
MSAAPRKAAVSDLGAGFIVETRPNRGRVIVAGNLAGAGVAALMSTAPQDVREDRALQAWAAQTGGVSAPLAMLAQVHGATVLKAPLGRRRPDADGMWSAGSDVALAVRIADCAPVWVADAIGRRFALLHAGWRGVAAGIVPNALSLLTGAGSKPADLVVAVGPHLQSCCFEVGPDVAERFSPWPQAIVPSSRLKVPCTRADGFALDMGAAIAAQLRLYGVRDRNVAISAACTYCNAELFHSYRRNGAGGPLMGAIAAAAIKT